MISTSFKSCFDNTFKQHLKQMVTLSEQGNTKGQSPPQRARPNSWDSSPQFRDHLSSSRIWETGDIIYSYYVVLIFVGHLQYSWFRDTQSVVSLHEKSSLNVISCPPQSPVLENELNWKNWKWTSNCPKQQLDVNTYKEDCEEECALPVGFPHCW